MPTFAASPPAWHRRSDVARARPHSARSPGGCRLAFRGSNEEAMTQPLLKFPASARAAPARTRARTSSTPCGSCSSPSREPATTPIASRSHSASSSEAARSERHLRQLGRANGRAPLIEATDAPNPVAERLELPKEYARPGLTLAWDDVRARLAGAIHYCLATLRPNGRQVFLTASAAIDSPSSRSRSAATRPDPASYAKGGVWRLRSERVLSSERSKGAQRGSCSCRPRD